MNPPCAAAVKAKRPNRKGRYVQLSPKAVRRGTPSSQLRSSAGYALGNDSILAEYYSTSNKSSVHLDGWVCLGTAQT